MNESLVEVRSQIENVIKYIRIVVGDLEAPKEIEDDRGLNVVQENIQSLINCDNVVCKHYAPLKKEARKPWDDLVQEEKGWVQTIEKIRNFLDGKVRAYNNRRRIEIQKQEQAEAEERARIEREKLEREKVELEAAGNVQAAQEVEEIKQAVVAGPVAEKKIMNRGDFNTMSESESIEDFIIVNHMEFAAALIESGCGSMVVLDKKTETAFKKYLVNTARDVKTFPGITFRRDWKTIYKKK